MKYQKFPKDFMSYAELFQKLNLEVTDAMSNDATGSGAVYFTGPKSNYCCEILISNYIDEKGDINITIEDLQDGSKSFEQDYLSRSLPDFRFSGRMERLLIQNGVIPRKLITVSSDIVRVNTAKMLKAIGFNNQCPDYYDEREKHGYSANSYIGDWIGCVHAPTLEEANKWMRINYGYHIAVSKQLVYENEEWKFTGQWEARVESETKPNIHIEKGDDPSVILELAILHTATLIQKTLGK